MHVIVMHVKVLHISEIIRKKIAGQLAGYFSILLN